MSSTATEAAERVRSRVRRVRMRTSYFSVQYAYIGRLTPLRCYPARDSVRRVWLRMRKIRLLLAISFVIASALVYPASAASRTVRTWCCTYQIPAGNALISGDMNVSVGAFGAMAFGVAQSTAPTPKDAVEVALATLGGGTTVYETSKPGWAVKVGYVAGGDLVFHLRARYTTKCGVALFLATYPRAQSQTFGPIVGAMSKSFRLSC